MVQRQLTPEEEQLTQQASNAREIDKIFSQMRVAREQQSQIREQQKPKQETGPREAVPKDIMNRFQKYSKYSPLAYGAAMPYTMKSRHYVSAGEKLRAAKAGTPIRSGWGESGGFLDPKTSNIGKFAYGDNIGKFAQPLNKYMVDNKYLSPEVSASVAGNAGMVANYGQMAFKAGAQTAMPIFAGGIGPAMQARRLRGLRETRKELGPKSGAATAERAGALSGAIRTATMAPALTAMALPSMVGGGAGFGYNMLKGGGLAIPQMVGKGVLGLTGMSGKSAALTASAAKGGGIGASLGAGMLSPMAIGGLTMALPGIISAFAGMKAASTQRRLRGKRESAFQITKKYRMSQPLEGFISQLASSGQLKAPDQIKIELLKMIEMHTSPIPMIGAIVKFIEDQRKKDTKTSIDKYSEKQEGWKHETTKETFKQKASKFADIASTKLQQFSALSPLQQIATMVLERKMPGTVKRELRQQLRDIKRPGEERAHLKKVSEMSGASIPFLRLVSTDAQTLIKLGESPESKRLLVLMGLYDLQREYIRGWIENKNELKKNGMKIEMEEEVDAGKWWENIPGADLFIGGAKGIKAIANTIKDAKDVITKQKGWKETGIGGKVVGAAENIKERWKKFRMGDEAYSYLKDPDALKKKLGLFQTQKERVSIYLEKGLPDHFNDAIQKLKEQVNILQNIYNVNNEILRAQTGEGREFKEEISTDKKIWDSLSGKSLSKQEYNIEVYNREQLAQDKLKKAFKIKDDELSKKFGIKNTLQKAGMGAGAAVALGIIGSTFGLPLLPILGIVAAGATIGGTVGSIETAKSYFGQTQDKDKTEISKVIKDNFKKDRFKDDVKSEIKHPTLTDNFDFTRFTCSDDCCEESLIILGKIQNDISVLTNLATSSTIGLSSKILLPDDYYNQIADNIINKASEISSRKVKSAIRKAISPFNIGDVQKEQLKILSQMKQNPIGNKFISPKSNIADSYDDSPDSIKTELIEIKKSIQDAVPTLKGFKEYKNQKEQRKRDWFSKFENDGFIPKQTSSDEFIPKQMASGGYIPIPPKGKTDVVSGEAGPEKVTVSKGGIKFEPYAGRISGIIGSGTPGNTTDRDVKMEMNEAQVDKEKKEGQKFKKDIIGGRTGLGKIIELLEEGNIISKKSGKGSDKKGGIFDFLKGLGGKLLALLAPLATIALGIGGLLLGMKLLNWKKEGSPEKATATTMGLKTGIAGIQVAANAIKKGEEASKVAKEAAKASKAAAKTAAKEAKIIANASKVKGIKGILGTAGKGIKSTLDASKDIKGTLGLAAKGTGKALLGGGKIAAKGTGKALLGGTKTLGKFAVKSVAKKIPILGAVAGGVLAVSRLSEGDVAGAALELASGLTSFAGPLGLPFGLALDAYLYTRDVKKDTEKQNAENKNIDAKANETLLKIKKESSPEVASLFHSLGQFDKLIRNKKVIKQSGKYVLASGVTIIDALSVIPLKDPSTLTPKQKEQFNKIKSECSPEVSKLFNSFSEFNRLVRLKIIKKDINTWVLSSKQTETKVKASNIGDTSKDIKSIQQSQQQQPKQKKGFFGSLLDVGKRLFGVGSNIVSNAVTGTPKTIPTNQIKNPKIIPDFGLGSLSEKYETGGQGVGTISTGQGDYGGKSYGKYQMSSRGGDDSTISKFIKLGEWSDKFKGLKPGTKQFDEKWKEVAKTEGEKFGQSQHEYIKKTHFDPLSNKLNVDFGLDISKRSKALQNVLWSTGVQHGGNTNLINKALSGKDIGSLSDEDIINEIYKERSKKNKKGELAYFSKNSSKNQLSVAERFKNEKDDALAMLKKEMTVDNIKTKSKDLLNTIVDKSKKVAGVGSDIVTNFVGKDRVENIKKEENLAMLKKEMTVDNIKTKSKDLLNTVVDKSKKVAGIGSNIVTNFVGKDRVENIKKAVSDSTYTKDIKDAIQNSNIKDTTSELKKKALKAGKTAKFRLNEIGDWFWNEPLDAPLQFKKQPMKNDFGKVNEKVINDIEQQRKKKVPEAENTYTMKKLKEIEERKFAEENRAMPQMPMMIPGGLNPGGQARTERYRPINESALKLIDDVFSNTILRLEGAIKTFAISQSPFQILR